MLENGMREVSQGRFRHVVAGELLHRTLSDETEVSGDSKQSGTHSPEHRVGPPMRGLAATLVNQA